MEYGECSNFKNQCKNYKLEETECSNTLYFCEEFYDSSMCKIYEKACELDINMTLFVDDLTFSSLKNSENDIPNYGKNLERAINSCMTHKTMYRDHLCCGNASVADFMINLFLISRNNEYLEKAKALLLPETEYAYFPETYRNTFSAGLLFGASGVGYELLRLIKPEEIESVLI